MSSSTIEDRFPAAETNLEISDGRVTLRVRFGGTCCSCNEDLDSVHPDHFGRLMCPSCGLLIGPVLRAAGVSETDHTDVDETGEWPVTNTGFELNDGRATVRRISGGECECGHPLVKQKARRFGGGGLLCPDCEHSVNYAVQYNVLKDPLEEADQDA